MRDNHGRQITQSLIVVLLTIMIENLFVEMSRIDVIEKALILGILVALIYLFLILIPDLLHGQQSRKIEAEYNERRQRFQKWTERQKETLSFIFHDELCPTLEAYNGKEEDLNKLRNILERMCFLVRIDWDSNELKNKEVLNLSRRILSTVNPEDTIELRNIFWRWDFELVPTKTTSKDNKIVRFLMKLTKPFWRGP